MLEAVLETAMGLEVNYNITVDLELILEELPIAFQSQMRSSNYVNNFKQHITSFAFTKVQQEMYRNNLKQSTTDTTTIFKAPKLNNQFQSTPYNYHNGIHSPFSPMNPTPYNNNETYHQVFEPLTQHPITF
ncbi:hypothetical protein [Metabacillus fastidiosus]|uniref:hypothetical protein n=1 Tax=Metabacillus fastidiosus TaxID=1458 RepID=UPI002DB94E7E|nr:hypothetical protein [Metabacillus fastidiosus]MEC2074519.1 hypothetical protein [Metabacillus fastidiosus]